MRIDRLEVPYDDFLGVVFLRGFSVALQIRVRDWDLEVVMVMVRDVGFAFRDLIGSRVRGEAIRLLAEVEKVLLMVLGRDSGREIRR